jgi:hypothetical protein
VAGFFNQLESVVDGSNQLGINLRQFALESDQGFALAAVCRKHEQIHLLRFVVFSGSS